MLTVTSLYRFGNWAYRMRIPLLPLLCKAAIRLLFNCAVDPSTQIGDGTTFAYGGIAVVIHKRARIGKNVVISQQVTIGGRSRSKDVPVIEDDVYIGAGAKILGSIHVGNGSVIGANAVVIHDVPAQPIAAGVPARIIRTGIDRNDYV